MLLYFFKHNKLSDSKVYATKVKHPERTQFPTCSKVFYKTDVKYASDTRATASPINICTFIITFRFTFIFIYDESYDHLLANLDVTYSGTHIMEKK